MGFVPAGRCGLAPMKGCPHSRGAVPAGHPACILSPPKFVLWGHGAPPQRPTTQEAVAGLRHAALTHSRLLSVEETPKSPPKPPAPIPLPRFRRAVRGRGQADGAEGGGDTAGPPLLGVPKALPSQLVSSPGQVARGLYNVLSPGTAPPVTQRAPRRGGGPRCLPTPLGTPPLHPVTAGGRRAGRVGTGAAAPCCSGPRYLLLLLFYYFIVIIVVPPAPGHLL